MGILAFAASFLIGWIQETLFYSSILSKIFFVSKDVTEVYLSSKAKTQNEGHFFIFEINLLEEEEKVHLERLEITSASISQHR